MSNLGLNYLKVELFACANHASVVVDDEAVVFVSHGDVIKEGRAAESPNGGHMCPNSAVFHDLESQRTVGDLNPHFWEIIIHKVVWIFANIST